MQHTKQHQEQGMYYDLLVQRLASSKSFRNKFIIFSYLQWKKTYQFCQAVKWKDETANSRCHSGTVVLAPLHDPQEFKQLFKDPLFLNKVRSYKSNYSRSVYTFHVQRTLCHTLVRGCMMNQEQ
jgi:hypothetical protein